MYRQILLESSPKQQTGRLESLEKQRKIVKIKLDENVERNLLDERHLARNEIINKLLILIQLLKHHMYIYVCIYILIQYI